MEKPIIFSAPMIRAIFDGTKTQTRRIIKNCPEYGIMECHYSSTGFAKDSDGNQNCSCIEFPNPWGFAQDYLWVRETFAPTYQRYEDQTGEIQYLASSHGPWFYKATDNSDKEFSWKPSIHMPRAASRIKLEIIKIEAEKLNDISEIDAEAEGVQFLRDIPDADETLTAKQLFKVLWESIHGDGSWDLNPFVWKISFIKVKP
jgi:hypothetical protein